MELKFIQIQASAIAAFEVSFLNKLFSVLLKWDPQSFKIVKIKYQDGTERLAIDAPANLDTSAVLAAVDQVEDLIRSKTMDEIMKQIDVFDFFFGK